MRNLIVCCDGTWNTADEVDGNGVPVPTNVAKLYNATAESETQHRYYHPGVGTNPGFKDWLLGGTMGSGLVQNVKSAYVWLAQNYQPGDRIFLFGFSRGAYTARAIAGAIDRGGLLDLHGRSPLQAADWALVDELFQRLHKRLPSNDLSDEAFFKNEAGKRDTPIWFIGVWDTVGALGVPRDIPFASWFDDPKDHEFHDNQLSPKVQNARHAVALDEMRANFLPTLWAHKNGKKLENTEQVKQVWFPGCHSDVGGGYAETGLSDCAFKWMLEEAMGCGLEVLPTVASQHRPDSMSVLHNSFAGVFQHLKSAPRSVPWLEADIQRPDLSPSVIDRLSTPSLSQGVYRASRRLVADGHGADVEIFAHEHWNNTGIYLEAGVEYHFRATGEWADGGMVAAPDGSLKQFYVHQIVHWVLSGLGKLETLYRRLTRNSQADFWMTKREEAYPWFSLVGSIANGSSGDPSVFRTDEVFNIGKHTRHTPKRSGYLYGFANDAWYAYGNNRGSVKLEVSRHPIPQQ